MDPIVRILVIDKECHEQAAKEPGKEAIGLCRACHPGKEQPQEIAVR